MPQKKSILITLLLLAFIAPYGVKGMSDSEKWPYPSEKSYAQGKLPPYKYKPLSRPNRSSSNHVVLFSSYKIFRQEQPYDRFDKCFTVAVTEQLGITGFAPNFLPIAEAEQLITECNIIEKYYYPIKKPKKNCLVVYANSQRKIMHFATVTTSEKHNLSKTCWVKSKLGCINNIYEHLLFDVPLSYRNKVSFYQLQKTFRNDKKLLLQSIQQDIAQSKAVKHKTIKMEKILILLVKGQDVYLNNDKHANQQNSIMGKIVYLFKNYMCLNANVQNSQGDSLIMCAAIHNQAAIVQALLSLGANINHQNTRGHTALMGAVSFKHPEVTQVLLCNNANTSLKDKNGWTALQYAIAVSNYDFINQLAKKANP